MALFVLITIAAMGGPIGILLFYALVRPRFVLAFFGRGRGDDLPNAVLALRLALAGSLFGAAFLAGMATAFLSRTTPF